MVTRVEPFLRALKRGLVLTFVTGAMLVEGCAGHDAPVPAPRTAQQTEEVRATGDDDRDGRYLIAFTSGRDIYAIDPDGSGLRNLTDSESADRWSRWSPDGKEMAYESY